MERLNVECCPLLVCQETDAKVNFGCVLCYNSEDSVSVSTILKYFGINSSGGALISWARINILISSKTAIPAWLSLGTVQALVEPLYGSAGMNQV